MFRQPWSLELDKEQLTMVRKVMAFVIVSGALAVAACNTVRGAGQDLGSAANCTENAIHGGRC